MRPRLSGDEFEVRSKQTPRADLNPASLLEHIKGLSLHDNPSVYLNWRDLRNMIKIKYDQFVECEEMIGIAWYPVRDDLDILIPDHCVYSIDHHDGIWSMEW